jgi:hypothetical protein
MSNIKIFENKKVRSQYDADKEMWYFSIVDIVGILPVLADVSSVSIRTIEPKATLIPRSRGRIARSRGRIVREHKNDRAQSNPNTKENPKWTVAHLSETSSWVKEYH